METFPSPGGFHHYKSGSSGTAWFRRPARAALLAGLPGLRFELLYFCGSPGADALGHTGSLLGHSEQGVLFPEGSQARVKELLKACPFVKGAANSTQPASRGEPSFEGQKEGVKLKSTQHTTTVALHFHLGVSVTSQVRWVVRFPRSRVVVVTLVRGVSGAGGVRDSRDRVPKRVRDSRDKISENPADLACPVTQDK